MGYASYLENVTERHYSNVTGVQDGRIDGLSRGVRPLNLTHVLKFLGDIESILPAPPFHINDVLQAERELLRVETTHVGRLAADELRAVWALRDGAWKSLEERWQTFVAGRLSALLNYRPRLSEVGPLWLNDEQKPVVARDFEGHRRINAAAGTGKTVVLVHRAIRLFAQRRGTVLIVTPSDALSVEISDAIRILAGIEDGPQLRVRSLTQIIDSWHETRGQKVRMAPRDILDREWGAFVDTADVSSAHILSSPDMTRFLTEFEKQSEKLERRKTMTIPRWVSHRRRTWIDRWRALNYIFDEMIYIASGFQARTIDAYTGASDAKLAPRVGRGRAPTLERHERRLVMKVFEEWKHWLANKNWIESAQAAAELGEGLARSEAAAREFTELFAADHVLVDEAHEFGTSEWSLILRLVRNIRTTNALLAAGDPEQRWRTRRLVPSEIQSPDGKNGLMFRGRTITLTEQFRITRHIGTAAERLVNRFPKPDEEDAESIAGLGAIDDGVMPLVLETEDQERAAADLLKRITPSRTVALVTARADAVDIDLCERIVNRSGCEATRFQRSGKRKRARVAYGTIEVFSGCEFDVVIVLNFSALPASHVPKEEWWREAASAYQAITRARELVVLVCPKRGPFVDALLDDPPVVRLIDPNQSLDEYLMGYASHLGKKTHGPP